MTIVKDITIFYNIYIMITYRPFWKTLKEKNISTYTLINKFSISSATIDRMRKGMGISTAKLDDLCKILDCGVSDIVEYVKEETENSEK